MTIRRFATQFVTALYALTLLGVLPLTGRLLSPAFAQRHPPEIRGVYPLGGSTGATTRVTISGVSFRNASMLLFDRPGVTATLAPQNLAGLPAPNLDSDGDPNVVADIEVAKGTAPGVCRFRVVSPGGVSDAGLWMIGRDLPQSEEKEPNNEPAQAQAVTLPAAINGHIDSVSDQDTFAFNLKAEQTFVAEVQANRVGSPLDSLLTLRGTDGRELATNDDHNGPDSLLVYTPKTAGRYFLTLASSDGQAGPNFAYRLEVGILPLLTSRFPAGASIGTTGEATTSGVNLANIGSIKIPANPSVPSGLEPVFVAAVGGSSNSLPLMLMSLPAQTEQEPNDDRAHSMLLLTPGMANGRFRHEISAGKPDKPGPDTDFYRFKGEAGQRYVMDVLCQQIDSPAYPVLTLYGPDRKEIATNDGTNGHNAHLDVTLPQSGEYALRITELRGQTGPDYVYCLTVQTPAPGFALAVETRARSVGQGGTVPLEVTVTRDRWEGPVVLGVRDLPSGVTATTCIVPPGVNHGLLLLSADKTTGLAAFPLRIVGAAQIQGTSVQLALESASDWVWKGGQRANVAVPPGLLDFAVSEPFEITPLLDTQALSLSRGQSAMLKVKLTRQTGYAKPVTLHVLNLPDGVTAADVAVPGDKSEATVELKSAANARLGAAPLTVTCLVSQSQFVQLDRATPLLTLTITDPPKK
jgi:hypothetical protein